MRVVLVLAGTVVVAGGLLFGTVFVCGTVGLFADVVVPVPWAAASQDVPYSIDETRHLNPSIVVNHGLMSNLVHRLADGQVQLLVAEASFSAADADAHDRPVRLLERRLAVRGVTR